MAGRRQRGSRAREQSSRRGSSLALAAVDFAAEPGTATTPVTSAAPAPTTPTASTPSPKSIWRLLQMKGLTPDEAANLTAFLYGLPTADLRWTLPQLNQLLFLRDIHQSGRFGRDDGGRDLRP